MNQSEMERSAKYKSRNEIEISKIIEKVNEAKYQGINDSTNIMNAKEITTTHFRDSKRK